MRERCDREPELCRFLKGLGNRSAVAHLNADLIAVIVDGIPPIDGRDDVLTPVVAPVVGAAVRTQTYFSFPLPCGIVSVP